jgi:hypothetical protein
MFRMARNMHMSGTNEVELLEELKRALQEVLPSPWLLSATHQPRLDDSGPDLVLTATAPDGSTATVIVEAKRVVEPVNVPTLVNQIRNLAAASGTRNALLASQFVSPLTRQLLEKAGVGWFDATGNLRLRVDQPAVFVDRHGADRNPFTDPDDRRLRSLRGPAAARVVRALCTVDLPERVRTLAERAKVGLGSCSRVLELLDREALIDRDARSAVVGVHKGSLVRRWTQDYGVTVSNIATPMLDPRGLDHATAALASGGERYAVSGSAAARAYLPSDVVAVAPFTTLVVHTDQPVDLIQAAGLKRIQRGANVLLVEPFDRVLIEDTRTIRGVRYAAPAQVVADLLTGPGRGTEEAGQLIQAMAANDPGWAA